ncbi:MAG: lamin tail domain-containing protein [Verrucomicrobiales bacterium]
MVNSGGAQGLRITEFLADPGDKSEKVDEDFDESDWVEIHNDGAAPVDLGGHFLTDDPLITNKWPIPAGAPLAVGAYRLVFASGKDRRPVTATGVWHTNFKLRREGGSILLIAPDGQTVVSGFTGYPRQKQDVSFGLSNANAAAAFFSPPSPGRTNAVGFPDYVRDTDFSVPRGYHSEAFNLSITTTTPGATIRYTLNGTLPTTSNGTVYTGPIPISRTTPVRAIAYKDGLLATNVDTHTYLFLDDVARQNPGGAVPPGFPSSTSYGMDPEIINKYGAAAVKDSLASATAICLTMRAEDFAQVNNTGGAHGEGTERPASFEWLDSQGGPTVQIDCGMRIRGGFRRGSGNPKHAWRLFFSSQYEGRLRFPFFGDEGANRFGKMDLRCQQNYSWTADGDSRYTELTDVFSRDTQRDMGQPYTRSRRHHLFINGHYWGVYESQERAEAYFGATYLGGRDEDYDAIKSSGLDGGYTTEATDGNLEGDWRKLWQAARAGDFMKAQGLKPDGTRDSSLPVLLDADNLIDYMLCTAYTGDSDGPIGFIGASNNWYAVRNAVADNRGFSFFRHDAEHSMGFGPPWFIFERDTSQIDSFERSNPYFLHVDCNTSPEYVVRFNDRAYKHLAHGGALTEAKCRARLQFRKDEIEPMIIAEAARWGDARSEPPFDKSTWESATQSVFSFIQGRTEFLSSLVALPPEFSIPRGGVVPAGTVVTVSPPAGVRYTTNGSDPRLVGGAVNPVALSPAGGTITINQTTTIKMRSFVDGKWSALNEVTFIVGVPASAQNLVVSEVHYHPAPPTQAELGQPGVVDQNSFEFIELLNVSDATVDLAGVAFGDGVEFAFLTGAALAPRARILVVKNRQAFERRYASLLPLPIAGEFLNDSSLRNSGEQLLLLAADGTTPIAVFSYNDREPWPTAADGDGFSLTLSQPRAGINFELASAWRASAEPGGSPGGEDGLPAFSGNPAADTDCDGFYAWLEYALGSSDTVAGDAPTLTATSQRLTVEGVPGDFTLLRFGFDRRAAGVALVIEQSEDLRAWTRAGDGAVLHEQTDLPGGKSTATYRASTSGKTTRFYRLAATPSA